MDRKSREKFEERRERESCGEKSELFGRLSEYYSVIFLFRE
tara:strand:- start:1613 stop:1735 length:123 start_codon:yes stop_codon:yes gene_type:complete